MKNIQIVDGADNCTFSIFQATDEEFSMIFPEPSQDIEFSEDLYNRIGEDSRALDGLWERPVLKTDALGIHGTLFYGFEKKRDKFPKTKRERDWDSSAINAAQRKLYAQQRRVESLILSFSGRSWQKVAFIIAKVIQHCDENSMPIVDKEVFLLIEALIKARKLEFSGDLSTWRHSEIRLPLD